MTLQTDAGVEVPDCAPTITYWPLTRKWLCAFVNTFENPLELLIRYDIHVRDAATLNDRDKIATTECLAAISERCADQSHCIMCVHIDAIMDWQLRSFMEYLFTLHAERCERDEF